MQTSEQPDDGGVSSGSDQSIRTLLSDVDEFLKYIAIVKTPEVDAVRAALVRSLGSAKHELLKTVARARKNRPGAVAAHFLANPWPAIAAAAVLGAWFGTVLHAPAGARHHRVR